MVVLQVLIGLMITKSEEVHDYIQIMFSDGSILSIFNNYAYDGGSIKGIEGNKVKSVEESDNNILVILDDESTISVGLRDDDYNGSEAMVLKQEGRSPVVWN